MNTTSVRKICRYAVSFAAIVLLVFAIPHCMPGDPVMAFVGEDVVLTPELLDHLNTRLGLDKPLHEQFSMFLQSILNGDFGYSYRRHDTVAALILERLPWTLSLAVTSTIIGYASAVVFGSYAGWHAERRASRGLTVAALCISCIPAFLLGLILYAVFVYQLRWFPFKGLYTAAPDLLDVMWHMALPVFALSLLIFARNLLIMRGSVLTEKNQLYPQFAASLGTPQSKILYGHVMKNAILPIITHIAMSFGSILSGALFVEIIFSLNGMGLLMYKALTALDYPVLSGLLLILGIMVVLANIAADVLYGIVDPRVWRTDK